MARVLSLTKEGVRGVGVAASAPFSSELFSVSVSFSLSEIGRINEFSETGTVKEPQLTAR